ALAGRHSARARERRVSGRERTGSRGRRARKGDTRSGTKMTEARTDPDLLYVGTYTESIYLVRMDRRSGELLRVGAVNAGANPSFLSMHPNGGMLYAVNEVEHGAVSAFAIAGGTGELTRRGEQPSQGAAPCYLSVDSSGRAVLVANYDGGSVALLSIQMDGTLAPAAQVVHH